MSLKKFSTKDLKYELKRRENLGDKPQQLDIPKLSNLKDILSEYIDDIFNNKYNPDSDDVNYIFEEAMKAFYGNDIFEWIGNNT